MATIDPRLQGIHSALVTPLESDRQTVDVDALHRLIDHVVDGGCTGVVVLGGTGEYPALSFSERARATEAAVSHTHGRVPVTVGIVSPGLADARQMAQIAEGAGANYIMPITPYYVRAGQDGIRSWYLSLAQATKLPIILYNIPSRTGVNLEPETVLQLTEDSDQFVGIKECNVDIAHVNHLIDLVSDRMSVLAGEDHYALPELMLGACGAILASSNVIPREWAALYDFAKNGDYCSATRIYKDVFPLVQAIFAEPNPGPLKAAMRLIGLDVGPVAEPLSEPSRKTISQLESALKCLRAEDRSNAGRRDRVA